jgi:AcrR family transcriptional regulator
MPKPTFFNLPEDKRRRLVELAIDEFASHSFREASLSRIVARAKIAKGSMYQYFEDKLDLYRWLLFEEAGRRKAELARQATGGDQAGLFARLEAQCLSALEFVRQHPRLARLAARAFEGSSEPGLRLLHEDMRAKGRALVEAELRQAVKRGEVRAGVDVRVAARLLLHVLGPGMAELVLDELGIDLAALLEHPSRAAELSPRRLQKLAQAALEVLEHGLGGRDKVAVC